MFWIYDFWPETFLTNSLLHTLCVFGHGIKTRESNESRGAFSCFDTVIKHAKRIVKIASQINAINSCLMLMIVSIMGDMGSPDNPLTGQSELILLVKMLMNYLSI